MDLEVNRVNTNLCWHQASRDVGRSLYIEYQERKTKPYKRYIIHLETFGTLFASLLCILDGLGSQMTVEIILTLYPFRSGYAFRS